MLSLRLKTIADLIPNKEKVIDIGTDHAYLPIYLVKIRNFPIVYASEKNSKILKQSLYNIERFAVKDKINLIVADGLKNINDRFDVAVIAGMGTATIIKILKEASQIPSILIIQSNNCLPELRKFMMNLGYKITNEIVIYEKKKYYNIIKYIKGEEVLSREEIEFGKSYHKKYLMMILNKYERNYLKNNDENLKELILDLRNFIEKIPD